MLHHHLSDVYGRTGLVYVGYIQAHKPFKPRHSYPKFIYKPKNDEKDKVVENDTRIIDFILQT
jgi:hypothetical protein